MIRGSKVVLLRDIRTYITNFYGAGFRTIQTVLETLLFAYILTIVVSSTVVGGLTYLQFFALGSLVFSIFAASFSIGHEIFLDREYGYLKYLMSLPLSRTEVVLGRTLGGSIRAIVNVLPLYGIALVILPTSVLNVLASLGLLFVFSVGLCGLGMTISLTTRRETKVRLVNILISLILIRSSTVVYPSAAMPVWLQVGTRFNPVTYAADSLRTIYISQSFFALDKISVVLAFAVVMAVIGSWIFTRIVQGSPAE